MVKTWVLRLEHSINNRCESGLQLASTNYPYRPQFGGFPLWPQITDHKSTSKETAKYMHFMLAMLTLIIIMISVDW